ncbi:MAG: hypothetical protein A2W37_03785 [Chloroflexi bacterium RBG_16_63_12]|nr:MAG: hypothetical protein A2W37_03785 [Chloroflexi bacterium RBG_16_63_12]
MRKFHLIGWLFVAFGLLGVLALSTPRHVAASSALAITPTFTPTVIPTTPPGTPPPTPTSPPAPIVVDPLITKLVDLQRAQVGDPVQFTIVVTNPNTIEIKSVIVTDPLPVEVDFESATTTRGTYTYDQPSHTLTFDLNTMPGGEVITIVIHTRVNALGQPPDLFSNVARVSHDGQCCAVASNTVTAQLIPEALPAAGNGPGPIEILAMTIAGLTGTALLLLAGWLTLRWARNR